MLTQIIYLTKNSSIFLKQKSMRTVALSVHFCKYLNMWFHGTNCGTAQPPHLCEPIPWNKSLPLFYILLVLCL